MCCFGGKGRISAGDSPGIVLPKQDLFFFLKTKTKQNFRLCVKILAKEKKAKFDKDQTRLQTEGFDF